MERTCSRERGVTLLEMLCVFVILMLLLALLFPVFSSSRHRAQDESCITNLQQVSHALTLYTADYDEAYPQVIDAVVVNRISPPGQTWRDSLLHYLKSDHFPECPSRELPGLFQHYATSIDMCGYALNRNLNGHSRNKAGYNLIGAGTASINFPASTITILDARSGIDALNEPDRERSEVNLRRYAITLDAIPDILAQSPGAMRHHGGANYTFADGHTRWLLPTQIRIEKNSDGITPGFGL